MNHQPCGRIVEIVGLPGAGKTTLFHALRCQDPSIHASNFPDVREADSVPFFAWNSLCLSPTLISLSLHSSRKFTTRELAWLAILRGWPTVLKSDLKAHPVTLLDQGPVYLLTETWELGPDYLREPKAERLWRNFYSKWANTLDTIVWIDATDDDLVQRIRSRDKGHPVKEEPTETICEFLARYRNAFERTIGCLTNTNPHMKVIQYNTSQITVDEIIHGLLPEFDC